MKNEEAQGFLQETPGVIFYELKSQRNEKRVTFLFVFFRYTTPDNRGVGHWEAVLRQREVREQNFIHSNKLITQVAKL